MNAEQLQQLVRVQGELATIETLHRENEQYREALRGTVDLCNALREYAPTLNMTAEKRLRDSLALLDASAATSTRGPDA